MSQLNIDASEIAEAIRSNLAEAVAALTSATEWIMTNGLADPKEALAGATPYLRMFGTVTGGWLMARQALAARGELDAGSDDADYLRAKVATARFYCEQVLPTAAGLVPSVTAGASVLYEVDGESLASV